MDKHIEYKIDIILEELKIIREDVNDLKKFKNKILGGLTVFVLILQLIGSYIFGLNH